MQDLDAPDSLTLGVQIDQRVALDSVMGLLVIDMTITNVSDSTLSDLAVGWFCDWDLGRQPADNITYTLPAAQIVRSTSSPVFVAQAVFSSWSDARYTLHGLDNTTTYAGFPVTRKDDLLRAKELPFRGVNDISTIVGVRFTSPIPAGHVRNLQHVIAFDTSEASAAELVTSKPLGLYKSTNSSWLVDPVQEIFPNPATGSMNVPVSGMLNKLDIAVVNVQGQELMRWSVEAHSERAVVPLDVANLAQGYYVVSISDGVRTQHRKLVIGR
jgi:hypothetical protein